MKDSSNVLGTILNFDTCPLGPVSSWSTPATNSGTRHQQGRVCQEPRRQGLGKRKKGGGQEGNSDREAVVRKAQTAPLVGDPPAEALTEPSTVEPMGGGARGLPAIHPCGPHYRSHSCKGSEYILHAKHHLQTESLIILGFFNYFSLEYKLVQCHVGSCCTAKQTSDIHTCTHIYILFFKILFL